MSGAEDRDLLAAEYVLGTLDADEARQAEEMLRGDAAFRESVAAWERRLAPLADLVPSSAPPPDLWARIEAATAAQPGLRAVPRLAPAPPSPRPSRQLAAWRVATAAALALAAGIAAFAVLREPPGHMLVAVLAPPGGTPVFVAETVPGGLRLRPAGPVEVAPGKDLELWALPAGASRPESLGVLPAAGKVVAVARFAPGTQLLVSLEPQGGSPTGQPTGPVVSAGRL